MKKRNIPGLDGYQASEDGRIFRNGVELKQTLNKGGYPSVNCLADKLVNRLVCKAWHPNPTNLPVVNHRDLDPTNNHKDNLEWLSTELNNVHAQLFRPTTPSSSYKIHVVYADGSDWIFKNIIEAEETLGVSRFDLWDSLKDNQPYKGLSLRHMRKGEALPKRFQKNTGMVKGKDIRENPRGILAKNYVTGEKINFPTVTQCWKWFNLSSGAGIVQGIWRDDKPRIFNKNWILLYSDEDTQFPELTDVEFNELRWRGQPRPVYCVRISTGEVTLYKSAANMHQTLGYGRKPITLKLRKQTLRHLNDEPVSFAKLTKPYKGLVFAYEDDKELVDYIQDHYL